MTLCLWVTVPVSATEETEPAIEFYSEDPELTILGNGMCGETLYWYVDSTYTLYIYGSGDMDFNYDNVLGTTPPWYNYVEDIVNIVIDEGCTSLAPYAFRYSTTYNRGYVSVESISFPSTLKKIGDWAFMASFFSDAVLETFALPEGLESIGSNAFYYAPFTEIVIPSTVISIGSSAFQGCTELVKMTVLPSLPPTAGTSLITGFPADLKIYVPSVSVSAYESASGWGDYAEWIVGGAGVGSTSGGSSGGSSITNGTEFLHMTVSCDRTNEFYWGDQVQFYVNYSYTAGWPEFDKSVIWSVDNATSAATTIDENGLLTIGIGENVMVGLLSVTATNVEYPSVYWTCVIKINKCERPVDGEVTEETISPVYQEQFDQLSNDIASVQSSIDELQSGGEAGADLSEDSSEITDKVGEIDEFEQSQMAVLDGSVADMKDKVTFSSFVPALAFVQKYLDLTFTGISGIGVIFYLPMFLGLLFYLCSRVPYGATKARGSRPPKSGKK